MKKTSCTQRALLSGKLPLYKRASLHTRVHFICFHKHLRVHYRAGLCKLKVYTRVHLLPRSGNKSAAHQKPPVPKSIHTHHNTNLKMPQLLRVLVLFFSFVLRTIDYSIHFCRKCAKNAKQCLSSASSYQSVCLSPHHLHTSRRLSQCRLAFRPPPALISVARARLFVSFSLAAFVQCLYSSFLFAVRFACALVHTFILSSFSVIFFYFYKVGAYIEGCVGFFFLWWEWKEHFGDYTGFSRF